MTFFANGPVSACIADREKLSVVDVAGEVHPSINITEPEEEVDMDVIVGQAKQKLDINIALSNSFGFGGHNSSIMFKAFKE